MKAHNDSDRSFFSAGPLRSGLVFILLSGLLLLLTILAGCRQEEVEEPFEPTASHAAYREGLEKMELADTELGRRWISASERAFTEAIDRSLPFEEHIFFHPAEPDAMAYRFTAQRGRRIRIGIKVEGGEKPRFFADLFRLGDEESVPEEPVASYSHAENALIFEPRRDNRYVLRVQPELLRGGMFTVRITEEPVLAFPVEGRKMADIHSFFGDPRDGGRRRHEGVDIFAERGTRILAVTEGTVRRVGARDLGGNIVLLWDEQRGLHYYYAHLDSQMVESGQRVRAGTPLGTVGNTGNAVTTPPHLHFGVYEPRFRAVDPWNFLKPGSGRPEEARKPELRKDRYVRASVDLAEDIPAGTIFRVLAAGPDLLTVQLPSHSIIREIGHEDVEAAETAMEAPREGVLTDDPFLYSGPGFEGAIIARIEPADSYELLGTNGSFLYVETLNGTRGWLRRIQG